MMVLLGDMPDITAGLIDRAIAAFDPAAGRAICVATVARRARPSGAVGPPILCRTGKLTGDKGGRALIAAHADLVCEIEADDTGPLTDIDTPEALAAYSA